MSTVSRVLSGRPDVSPATRERVQALIAERRFSPNNNAQRLKQQESRTVCAIVKGTSNALFASLLERLQNRIEEAGYTAAVSYLDEEADELEAARLACREAHPCGLFFLGASRALFQERFSQIHVPAVLLTASAQGMGFPNLSSVCTDDAAAAQAAMDFLLRQGRRRVAIIGGSLELSDVSRLRLEGCRRSLEAHGLSFAQDCRYETARFSLGSAHRAMGRLLASFPQTDAVFCMSDLMALGAMRALFDSGRTVPGDVSLMGFDGIPMSRYSVPRLATVQQDAPQIAARGMALLRRAMEGLGPAVYETVPFSILPGESVRPGEGFHKQEDSL